MDMFGGQVRGLAICVCWDGNRILVMEYYDRHKAQTFYRPAGGTIEFGERGEQAVHREFLEELGAEVEGLQFLGVLENIYTYEGRRGHEIVLVYDGHLADRSLYDRPRFDVNENGVPMKACWKRLDEFGPGLPPLYPDGLLELLRKA